jgi:membrane protein YqaA with SNARE-associated domain
VTLVLTTLGVCFLSALVPVVNAEAYLGGVGVAVREVGVWGMAGVAAVGQMLGKTIWYYLGRGATSWGWVRRKTETPSWQRRLESWRRRTNDRPLVTVLVLLASALAGFPPFAVISVLAGQLRVPLVLFWVVGLVGRWLRFAAVLGGVDWLVESGVVG